MVTKGILVTLEARTGREDEVEALLKGGLATVLDEPDTIVWLAVRLGPTSFAVVDAFPHEAGRQVHLDAGRSRVAELSALDLLAAPPTFTMTEVVAAKVPDPAV